MEYGEWYNNANGKKKPILESVITKNAKRKIMVADNSK